MLLLLLSTPVQRRKSPTKKVIYLLLLLILRIFSKIEMQPVRWYENTYTLQRANAIIKQSI